MMSIFSCAVDHLYVFGKKHDSSGLLFFNWAFFFFDTELYELFIYFGY